MSTERARLGIALAAFVGWIGWLGFLAATATRPTVLSRPQFLISEVDIRAELHEADGKPDPLVHVADVLFSREPKHPGIELDKPLVVTNLPQVSLENGWQGPGPYILPLVKEGDKYQVASIPRSPGYGGGWPRIYRVTPETILQLRQIREAGR